MSLENFKILLMKAPFTTTNPLEFKLRLVWGHEAGRKLVAEFSDCRWLPRAGEALVLPIDEADANNRCHDWHWFKVKNLLYDFENQVVCVVCMAMEPGSLQKKKPTTTPLSVKPKVEKTLPQVFKELEKRGEAIAANTSALTFETHFNETAFLEDVDEELAMLKKQMLEKPTTPKKSAEVVDVELESLRKRLDDM